MTTIPRAEINALIEPFSDYWGGDQDPPAKMVREYANDLRTDRDTWHTSPDAEEVYRENCAEADALDALVDRVEQEAADAMWSHTSGVNP